MSSSPPVRLRSRPSHRAPRRQRRAALTPRGGGCSRWNAESIVRSREGLRGRATEHAAYCEGWGGAGLGCSVCNACVKEASGARSGRDEPRRATPGGVVPCSTRAMHVGVVFWHSLRLRSSRPKLMTTTHTSLTSVCVGLECERCLYSSFVESRREIYSLNSGIKVSRKMIPHNIIYFRSFKRSKGLGGSILRLNLLHAAR